MDETKLEGDLLDAERERLQRYMALQRVAFGIIKKWLWLLILSFVFFSGVFAVGLVWHSARSVHRFTATTRLLYSPRKIERLQNISDKQLLSVIDRNSLKRKVGEKLQLAISERECLGDDLTVVQERKPTNLFTLTAASPTWVGAVRKVNCYAETLVEEYVEYRKRDLANLHAALMMRKTNLQNQIAEIESEETIAKGKAAVASPIETLVTLNALLSDQRRNLSLLKVQVANEEIKRHRLEQEVGDIGPAVLANATLIRKKSEELAEIDRELARLREIYTDINPKVLGKLDDRKACLAEFAALLHEHGLEGVDLESLGKVEKAAGELAELSLRMEVLAESQRSLQQEIESNEARSNELTAIIPSLERLRLKRAGLEETMRDFESQLADIDFLQMSLENDLQQLERAGGAGDKNPLGIKNFVLAIGGAAICTGSILVWIIALEIMFGKMRDADELAAYGDIAVLGALPRSGVMPEDEAKDVLGFVALAFCTIELPKDVTLVCRLPGVGIQKRFRETLDWSLTMAGVRSFWLSVVPTAGFEPPEGAETLINTVRKGSEGYFPVANRFMLAPTELQMLQADIEALKADFDQIFIFMPGGLRRGGSFFSQLLSVSSCAFIVAGANLTPRSELAYVRKQVNEAAKPMVGVVTGVSAHAARKEMNEPRETT